MTCFLNYPLQLCSACCLGVYRGLLPVGCAVYHRFCGTGETRGPLGVLSPDFAKYERSLVIRVPYVAGDSLPHHRGQCIEVARACTVRGEEP